MRRFFSSLVFCCIPAVVAADLPSGAIDDAVKRILSDTADPSASIAIVLGGKIEYGVRTILLQ